ncbi:MAG: hypothetical protein GY861_14525 [bacterium]|nr:hypothetical protein [bacterium]
MIESTVNEYTKIKNDRMRTKICKLMSEMLDDPDAGGIYQTSRFMSKMESFCLELRHEAIGWTWATACALLDKEKDPRKYNQGNLITDSAKDLDKE